MPHAALRPGAVAVVTGGASGIGLAAAEKFAELGLKVCIADLGEDRLARAAEAVAAASPEERGCRDGDGDGCERS